MSTSPFNRNLNPSMFLNLPSGSSTSTFYPHQFYTNALRNPFLSPFLLQPLLQTKSNPMCLTIPTDGSSSHRNSSPTPTGSTPTTSITSITNKNNTLNEHDRGQLIHLNISTYLSINDLESDLTDDEGSLDRDNKRRRTRTNFTSVQIDELERAFQDGKINNEYNLVFYFCSQEESFSNDYFFFSK